MSPIASFEASGAFPSSRAICASSTAEGLGLKSGDIIIEFSGRTVKTIYDYMDALGAGKAGDTVSLKWLRGGQPMAGEAVLKVRQ